MPKDYSMGPFFKHHRDTAVLGRKTLRRRLKMGRLIQRSMKNYVFSQKRKPPGERKQCHLHKRFASAVIAAIRKATLQTHWLIGRRRINSPTF